MKPTCDNEATELGYNRLVVAIGFHSSTNDNDQWHGERYLFVKFDTDLNDRFLAWDCDLQECVTINGWLFTFKNEGDSN
jgi:hypothetical protein